MEQLSWYIWLTPLLIVPIILLFAFIGCGARTGLRETEVERIAFDGDRGPIDRRGTIYVIRTDISAPITDATLAPTDNHGASWSPTGQQLAFGGWNPSSGTVRAGVWVLNVDLGGRPTSTPVLVANARDVNHLILNVAWGPGGLIAYEDENAIWTTPPTPGTSPARLTPVGVLAQHPTWSPDGRRLAFTNTTSGSTFIFVREADGAVNPLVPSSSGDEHEPNWNPNGSGIIFVRSNNLVYFDLRSNSERLILNDGRSPAFSPNSTRIAFVRGGRIWTCAANGSNQQPLTPGPHDERPSWNLLRLG